MIDALLSLPTLAGCLVFIMLTTVAGMAVYYATFCLHKNRHSEDAIKEIADVTGNLFRVVGWLFTLLLSLTFTEVVGELSVTENVIANEAVTIQAAHHNLRRFGQEETRDIQVLLCDYTQAVIDDDWPALADDELSKRADALLRQLGYAVLDLQPTGTAQETLQSRIIADIDRIAGFRQSRLQQAREKPSAVLIVVLFGFLITMVYFGIYQPRAALISLLSLYTVFVGVVIYLMLAMGDPFQGATFIDPGPLEYVLETMRAEQEA